MNKLSLRVASLLSLFVMVAGACGQKPGVHLTAGERAIAGSRSGSSSQGVIDPETGQLIDPETGEVIDPETGEVIANSDASTTSTRSATKSSNNQTGNKSSNQGTTTVSKTDKNGITATEIKIGFHAPLTGAAAVPLRDIQQGTTLYSKWLEQNSVTIYGRKVTTIFRDDQYNPTHAVEVCREMVERQGVFALIGGAGTDQIVACAQYAAQKNVPYLSAGVTERKLDTYKNYFAFTATYPGQGRMLAEMVYKFDHVGGGGKVWKDRCSPNVSVAAPCGTDGGGAPRVAVVYSNTDGFYDARDKFVQEFKAVSGNDVFKTYAITKGSLSQGDANALITGAAGPNNAGGLKPLGIDIVYMLTSPTNWLAILRSAQSQGYSPRWVGVGLTKGINTVAQVGCEQSPTSFENSLFFNPWMSVNHANNSQFLAAWKNPGNNSDEGTSHDIAFGLWGGSIVQHALYEAVGPDISRSKLIAKIETLKNVRGPNAKVNGAEVKQIYSTLNYSPSDHFGADQAHLLYGDCAPNPGKWTDVPGKQFVFAGNF